MPKSTLSLPFFHPSSPLLNSHNLFPICGCFLAFLDLQPYDSSFLPSHLFCTRALLYFLKPGVTFPILLDGKTKMRKQPLFSLVLSLYLWIGNWEEFLVTTFYISPVPLIVLRYVRTSNDISLPLDCDSKGRCRKGLSTHVCMDRGISFQLVREALTLNVSLADAREFNRLQKINVTHKQGMYHPDHRLPLPACGFFFSLLFHGKTASLYKSKTRCSIWIVPVLKMSKGLFSDLKDSCWQQAFTLLPKLFLSR